MKKNYFIHGTNSSILGLLKKTNFEIASPIDLMRDYKVGPMTGELNRGGYAVHHHKNNTSFYRLFDTLGLERVIETYTCFKIASKDETQKSLIKALEDSPEYGFSNINQILFYSARARQLGIELDQSPFKETIETFMEYADAYIQFLYLFKLLGIHIFPNNEKYNNLPAHTKDSKGNRNDFEDIIYSKLTMKKLLKAIRSANIDIKSISDNPLEEDLEKILNLLELPLHPVAKSKHWRIGEKNVDLGGETRFFTMKKSSINHKAMFSNTADYQFEALITNSTYRIEAFFANLFGKNEPNDMFGSELIQELVKDTEYKINKMPSLLDEEIIHIKDRFEIFKSILKEPKETYQFQKNESKFFKNRFPVILLSDKEDLISHIGSSEYRLNEGGRLKLGQEINLIATDNDTHRLEILNFLHANNINTVGVVLLSSLKKANKQGSEIGGCIYPTQENITLLKKHIWLKKLSKVTGSLAIIALVAFIAIAAIAGPFGAILPIIIGASLFMLATGSYLSLLLCKHSITKLDTIEANDENNQFELPSNYKVSELEEQLSPEPKQEKRQSFNRQLSPDPKVSDMGIFGNVDVEIKEPVNKLFDNLEELTSEDESPLFNQ